MINMNNEIKTTETVEEIIVESKRLQDKVRELLWKEDKMDELEKALKASIEYREAHPEVFGNDEEEIEEETEDEEYEEEDEYDEDEYNDDYHGESEYDRNTDWREWNKW